METKKVSISDIVCDQQIMPRDHIDRNYVDDLFEDLESGAAFPPVDLFNDGKYYYAADGYHRIEAFKKIGRDEIEAVIHNGDKRAAMTFASGANACHGKRRTNEDKRKAVKNLLMDLEWRKESDGTIAEHCKVSQPFVLKVRRELESTNNNYKSPTRRKTKKGGTMETKNIGKGGANSKDQMETSSVTFTLHKGLPPKATAKSKSTENDDGSGSDKTEIPHPTKDCSTVLAEARRIIKDLETALSAFKNSLPSEDKSNSLSEINFSDHLDRISQSMTKFVVFCSKSLATSK